MCAANSMLIASELKSSYSFQTPQSWLEVLVDFPGSPNTENWEEKLFIYSVPSDLSIQPGDILSVPFGSQVVGGIAIRFVKSLPENLTEDRIKEVEDVVTSGFFPPTYWELLNRVAKYYYTDLITVIRVALPPGLLGKSQRRIRLKSESIPNGAENFCNHSAQEIIALLKSQSRGDYSAQHIYSKVRNAQRGLRDLIKRGWVESYLEPPQTIRPKHSKAITLIIDNFPPDLTDKQREVIEVLRRRGGELWFNDLLQISKISSSVAENLAKKGYVVIEQREKLRFLSQPQALKDTAKKLSPSQTEALNKIQETTQYSQILLHGVTGSGKTEVYIQAIAPLLEKGQSALVLVPEIGLTPQLTDRFRARFGNKVCVYHSELSDGERYDTWRQMLTGEPQIVIGTRSAIFAPLPKLGLIILDEEHDSSFKQTQLIPTYHARQVARWRCELENCPLVLGSATPSLETWVNIQENTKHAYYLSLPERIHSRPLPPVEIVDMRRELQLGNRSIFSRSLQDALHNLVEQKKQGILFINRRGHSTFVSCRSCGYVVECPHCDVSLSYHYTHDGATELLRCHYCNHNQLHPRNCPECGSPYFKFFGSGTQKVTQELTEMFPNLKWLRFDSDTTRTKDAHRTLLNQFTKGEADVLVGTQMLTKGLDIANVTLVGVVAADGLLYHSDYRAAERAFGTLAQVAGRAGRGEDPGKVIIQTYSPEHPVIQAVRHHNYQGFLEMELPQRESLNYPPYGKLILIRLSGIDGVEVQHTAEILADRCIEMLGSMGEVLGPAPAQIMRVARRYRWQILLKFDALSESLLKNLQDLKNSCPASVKMAIDVDPMSID
ncbi:primosomal protein N' [Aphanothece hegewaldii CCALA 016]|uniref:Replication restart protein PriA n=1 Tax=Aphanothece hegewaldii CCALA 016 TaxID=2107694 RepID=A0A2T1M449_9CHRO|nr:primosomal protein N' [Aphanothece hegewaldii CCALA 016]